MNHRLKPHKADGVEDVSSDLLINGYHKLFIRLTLAQYYAATWRVS